MKQKLAYKNRNFVQRTKFTLAFIYKNKLRENIFIHMYSIDFRFMTQSDWFVSWIFLILISLPNEVESYCGNTSKSEGFVQNDRFKIVFFWIWKSIFSSSPRTGSVFKLYISALKFLILKDHSNVQITLQYLIKRTLSYKEFGFFQMYFAETYSLNWMWSSHYFTGTLHVTTRRDFWGPDLAYLCMMIITF